MEAERKEETNKRATSRRRKRSTTHSQCNTNSSNIFPLLLAAALSKSFASGIQTALLKKCLSKFHRSFLSQPQQEELALSIISLFPLLLRSNSPDIASLTADIVGAASLISFQVNQRVVSDSPTIRALVSLILTSRNRVSVAATACNALLDLCSTCDGRRQLLHLSALETLMSVGRSSILISLGTGDDVNIASLRICFQKCELRVLLLNAAITLINTCNAEQLERIPSKLSEHFSIFLKEVWSEAHKLMLNGDILGPSQRLNLYCSSITINNLAESIFRVSINFDQLPVHILGELGKRGIFGINEDDFKHFMLSKWEILPSVVRRFSIASLEVDEIFSSFAQSLKDIFPSSLASILVGLSSCLPIASDELDILNFLKEVRNKLGSPLINDQDIRVVRTDKQSKKEVPFFQEKLDTVDVNIPRFLHVDDILRCQEAYNKGYTIALRGMEFRFEKVALFADVLASIFGQPSAGANMYLTPPDSQGLAHHYDDHCVFVYQIFGSKQWKIFSQPNMMLPRLYDPCNIQINQGTDNSRAECYHFLLNEGDVLYIPRGCPHEACSHSISSDGSAGFSLHLTFGIEVEPPFEWEGFVHVALFHWNRTQQQPRGSSKDLSETMQNVAVKLLHIVIELLGNSDPTFRKACLVAAVSFQSDSNSWFDLHQRTIFSSLIEKISSESRLLEALKNVEVAIQRNEDPLQWIRWLRVLDQDKDIVEGHDWDELFTGAQDILPLYAQHKEMVEASFMQVKSKFCAEISYGDVFIDYKILLEKYKKARRQYMNGMLSLHSSCLTAMPCHH